LAGVVEVTAPEHGGSFTGQAARGVGPHAVIGNDDTSGRRHPVLGLPLGGLVGTGFDPTDLGHLDSS
jgi:hypothetical protein